MAPAPLKLAVAQLAPVLLDRAATLERVARTVEGAARAGAGLVVFGEALVPGYPVWLERTDGARFDSDLQKDLFARYADAAVCLEAGHLAPVQAAARAGSIAVQLGIIERPRARGHSLYCSSVHVGPDGGVASVHRKLVPTYEERLAWAPGDGAGLVVQPVGAFRLGALNCWENWMPLARAALYAAGEDLHVAHWPGGVHNTELWTRTIAKESRSFVVSVSGVLRGAEVPADFPERDRVAPADDEWLCNGGSCVAGPDGEWRVPPIVEEERVAFVDLDPTEVVRERQNFDPAGHYSRPDVLRLVVDRRRQAAAEFRDGEVKA